MDTCQNVIGANVGVPSTFGQNFDRGINSVFRQTKRTSYDKKPNPKSQKIKKLNQNGE